MTKPSPVSGPQSPYWESLQTLVFNPDNARMTQTELAKELGCSRETVNRIMRHPDFFAPLKTIQNAMIKRHVTGMVKKLVDCVQVEGDVPAYNALMKTLGEHSDININLKGSFDTFVHQVSEGADTGEDKEDG